MSSFRRAVNQPLGCQAKRRKIVGEDDTNVRGRGGREGGAGDAREGQGLGQGETRALEQVPYGRACHPHLLTIVYSENSHPL